MAGTLSLFVKELYRSYVRKSTIPPVRAMVTVAENLHDIRIKKDKQFKNRERLMAIFETITGTPPVACNPDATTEIHTVTAHHHAFMYLTAIKSFLRFFNDVAVVVHDDGSLTAVDCLMLREHVPGIAIIDKKSADDRMGDILSGYPYCQKFRNHVVNSIELFDNILLSRTDKIINLNSDILFFRKPGELISWICNDHAAIRGLYEENPSCQKEFLQEHSCRFPPHVTTAIACFFKRLYDINFVENILANVSRYWLTGQRVWFTAQNIYPLFYSNKVDENAISFFDRETYQGSGTFPDDPVFRHYWTSTGMFTGLQYRDSEKVIGELTGTRPNVVS